VTVFFRYWLAPKLVFRPRTDTGARTGGPLRMRLALEELGGAWVKSTKGAGATKARVSFSVAARNIANKIG